MNERDQIDRYAAMIESALPPIRPFVPVSEGPGILQVERGGILRLCSGSDAMPVEAGSYVDRLIASAAGQALPDVVNRGSHRRPGYLGLMVYAWIQACRLIEERAGLGCVFHWKPALLWWCKQLEAHAFLPAARDSTGIPAASGSTAASACWAALSLYAAGSLFDADERPATSVSTSVGAMSNRAHGSHLGTSVVKSLSERSAEVFATLAARQQPSGAMLLAGRSDNPEAYWYHELVILHAAASYAAAAQDAVVAAAVSRAAEYHLAETQPDHATSEPWALYAFVSNARCRPMADEMLHNSAVRAAGGPEDGVWSILLADALCCQRR